MELTIELRPSPGKFQELYQTLQALLPTIRKEEFLSIHYSRRFNHEK